MENVPLETWKAIDPVNQVRVINERQAQIDGIAAGREDKLYTQNRSNNLEPWFAGFFHNLKLPLFKYNQSAGQMELVRVLQPNPAPNYSRLAVVQESKGHVYLTSYKQYNLKHRGCLLHLIININSFRLGNYNKCYDTTNFYGLHAVSIGIDSPLINNNEVNSKNFTPTEVTIRHPQLGKKVYDADVARSGWSDVKRTVDNDNNKNNN